MSFHLFSTLFATRTICALIHTMHLRQQLELLHQRNWDRLKWTCYFISLRRRSTRFCLITTLLIPFLVCLKSFVRRKRPQTTGLGADGRSSLITDGDGR